MRTEKKTIEKKLDSKKMLDLITKAIFDKKGFNITCLDVRHVTPMLDYIVLAEGNVDRHLAAIAKNIEKELASIKEKPIYIEGDGKSGWIVIDFLDVVIHLFTKEVRALYQIEQLYKEGKIVEIYEPEVKSNG